MTINFKYLAATAFMVGAMSMPVQAADYVVDTKGAHASINFRVSHLGFSFVTGRFDKFSGNFSFDEKDPDKTNVKIEIDTTSVNTNHAERDKHVRSADFLEVDKFPTATFESTSFDVTGEKAVMHGNLTMHGVTKAIAVNVDHIGGGKDPWGGFRRGFVGSTVLKFKDFNIKKDFGTIAMDFVIEGVRKK
jgi:polyisoprenoid-binding protein YceI